MLTIGLPALVVLIPFLVPSRVWVSDVGVHLVTEGRVSRFDRVESVRIEAMADRYFLAIRHGPSDQLTIGISSTVDIAALREALPQEVPPSQREAAT